MVFARPVLAHVANRDRVVLFERTKLVYRALELTPRYGVELPPAPRRAPIGPPWRGGEPRSRVRSVLVLLVDALRADVIGASVGGRPVAPNLVRFGRASARFDRAYCTTPATLESFGAMMTGRRDAHEHDEVIDRASIGPLLRGTGVDTTGVYAHAALGRPVERLSHPVLFGDGQTNKHRQTAEITVEHLLAELDRIADARFFLLAHLYDPHAHYLENPEFDFGASPRQRYLGEVAYTDHHIGRVLDALEARHLDDEVAVIVVSDHGEEIWDHGYRWHRKRVYEESARVVLRARVPGASPRAIATPVSLVDLAPTVLDLLGVRAPERLDGISLVPAIFGEPLPRRPIFVTAGDRSAFAIIDETTKLIWSPLTRTSELFDLDRDPHERNNLADARPDDAARLRALLRMP
jgi:arylsulfatase A-like enzyme